MKINYGVKRAKTGEGWTVVAKVPIVKATYMEVSNADGYFVPHREQSTRMHEIITCDHRAEAWSIACQCQESNDELKPGAVVLYHKER